MSWDAEYQKRRDNYEKQARQAAHDEYRKRAEQAAWRLNLAQRLDEEVVAPFFRAVQNSPTQAANALQRLYKPGFIGQRLVWEGWSFGWHVDSTQERGAGTDYSILIQQDGTWWHQTKLSADYAVAFIWMGRDNGKLYQVEQIIQSSYGEIGQAEVDQTVQSFKELAIDFLAVNSIRP
ncbi:hypothetical protein [Catelliglobosispora koreensis]|uniref:hypothetical protein n=1 Tax=Catelliglobosispora koreensis TaxID=129052 RepID=UPI00036D5BDB|nr:hypothetical protein [Catelliglobosispora koreensis]